MTFKKGTWFTLGAMMLLAMWHPAAALAAAALASLPTVATDGLTQLAANLSAPVALAGASAVPLYTILENTLMTWLPDTPKMNPVKASLPLVFSGIAGLAGKFLGGASWLQIAMYVLTTWGGSVLTHQVLKTGQLAPISPDTYKAWLAKGDARVHSYNPDGSLKPVLATAPA